MLISRWDDGCQGEWRRARKKCLEVQGLGRDKLISANCWEVQVIGPAGRPRHGQKTHCSHHAFLPTQGCDAHIVNGD